MNVGAVPREGFPEKSSPDPGWGWSHIVLTAYGAWLYGDPRGFRTRHHREHIEGDYKHRPAARTYAMQEARSRRLLKQKPVEWIPAWRGIVGGALVARLQDLGAFVLCAAVSRRIRVSWSSCPAIRPGIGRD